MSTLSTGLIVSVVTVILGSVIAYCVHLNSQLSEQRTQIGKLETQMSPLWARVQAQISSDLHQPHPRYYEMDRLLEKLEALSIQPEERLRLKVLLTERSVDMNADITDEQRKKAKIMVGIMDLVVIEAKEPKV